MTTGSCSTGNGSAGSSYALDRLAAALLATEEPGRALDEALVAVQVDPLRKSAHRIVVRIHLRESNVPEALRAYEQFAQLLAQEVGVAPSTDMRRHVAPLLRPLTRYMLPANSVVLVP